MREEREKRDWREMSRTSYTCANPAYLQSPTQLARHTFLASPASRASRAPCGHSSALSLTVSSKKPSTTAARRLKQSALRKYPEPHHFLARDSGLHQLLFTGSGMLEISDQHPIKLPVSDPIRRRNRAREERLTRASINESHTVDIHLSKRQISQFG